MDQNAAVGLVWVGLLCGLAPHAAGQTVPDSSVARRDTPEMRTGFGFTLTGEQARRRGTMRSVFYGIPHLEVAGPGIHSFELLLRKPDGAVCAPALYIDGLISGLEELSAFRPALVARVDVYPRSTTAPFLVPDLGINCGVIAVWTTTRH